MSKKPTLAWIGLAASMTVNVVYSLGLGNVEVQSKLNQPFHATIDLVGLKGIPLRDLRVELAERAAFEKAGLIYSDYLGDIKYKLISKPQPHILLKTNENLSEPIINVMLRLYWPKGEVFRAYSILLDPPDYQLSRFTSTQSMDIESESESEQEMKPESEEKPSTKAVEKTQSPSLPEPSYHPRKVPVESKRFTPRHSEKKSTASQTHRVASGRQRTLRFIRTRRQDSLWTIAKRVQGYRDANIYQIMYALYQKNPHGFIGKNMNRLKAGIRLAIPDERYIKRYASLDARHLLNQKATPSRRRSVHPLLTQNAAHKAHDSHKEHVQPKPHASAKRTHPKSSMKRIVPDATNLFPTMAELNQRMSMASELPMQQVSTDQNRSIPRKRPSTAKAHATSSMSKRLGTQLSQAPSLQMKEKRSEEDEANLWFLDTFDFPLGLLDSKEDAKKPSAKKTASHQESKVHGTDETHQAQAGSRSPHAPAGKAFAEGVPNIASLPEVPTEPEDVDTSHPNALLPESFQTEMNRSNGQHQVLKKMLADHDQTLQDETQSLHEKLDHQTKLIQTLEERVTTLHSDSGEMPQSVQVVDTTPEGDSSWTWLLILTTLLGATGTAFFAYRWRLLKQLARDHSAHLDVSEQELKRDAISQSKRKISTHGYYEQDKASNFKPSSPEPDTSLGTEVQETVEPSVALKEESELVTENYQQAANSVSDVSEDFKEVDEAVVDAVPEEHILNVSIEDDLEKQEIPVPPAEEVFHEEPKPKAVEVEDMPIYSTPHDEVHIEEIVIEEHDEVPMEPRGDLSYVDDTSNRKSAPKEQSFDIEFEPSQSKYEIDTGKEVAIDTPESETALDNSIESPEIGFEEESLEDKIAKQMQAAEAEPDEFEDKLAEQYLAKGRQEDTPKTAASKESLGTKLDLARAYLTMDDKENAKEILSEVAFSGDPEQAEIAQKLLNELDQNEE